MPSLSTTGSSGLSAAERVLRDSQGLWTRQAANSKYENFRRRYWNDPIAFAHDCIMWEGDNGGPTRYQEEIMSALVEKKRVTVRGPHGLGKSALSSITILWFALTRDGDDWKIPTTASGWQQLERFLWPEIHKWSRKINWNVVGRDPLSATSELLTLNMRLRTGEAFAIASDDHNRIEGAHADHILYIFDESKTIPEATWDAAEGAMVNDQAYWLAVSTPGQPAGRFYDIHQKKPGYKDWWCRHVKVQETIDAGRVTMKWVADRRVQWGEASSVFLNRVLGEFAKADEDGVIPLDWIERANETWYRWQERVDAGEEKTIITQIGVDVARRGADKTIYAFRAGDIITEIMRTSKADTMQTAGTIVALFMEHSEASAVIDAVALGAGVYDRVYEQHPNRTYAFMAGDGAGDRTDKAGIWHFADMRSAAWWRLREMLDPHSGFELGLPPDDELTGDLVAPGWKELSNGRIKVESKETIRERLKRSTDAGDAVIQAFFDAEAAGMEFA